VTKHDHATCPNCGKKANNEKEVKEKFGLRNMGDGIIYVQSWCRKCRSNGTKYH